MLKDRFTALKAERDRAKAALERAKEHSASQIQIDPALDRAFRPHHAGELQHRLGAVSEGLLAIAHRKH